MNTFKIFHTLMFIGGTIFTVSAPIEPRGSFFQNEFLGGVQFKFCPQKVRFYQNLSFLNIFERTKIGKAYYSASGWGSNQEWGSIRADTVQPVQ